MTERGIPIVQTATTPLACAATGPEDGPLVLLVHGFPDTLHTWSHLQPVLADRGFRTVAYNQRGYAPSPVPADGAYDTETLGRDILALIRALGREKAIVIGHDWGASAVYSAAALAPDAIQHVVAVAIPYPTTIQPSLAKVWGVRHFFTLRLPGAVRRFARNDFAAVDTLYRRWSPGFDWPPEETAAVKRCFSEPGALDAALGYYRALTPRPPAFLWSRQKTPTTVIGGLTDGVATPHDFERSSKAYVEGACTVKMVPGGHFLHREHPKAFEAAVLDALAPYAP